MAASASGFTYILNTRTGLPYILPAGSTIIVIKLGNTQTLSDGTNYNTSAQAAATAWNAANGSMQLAPQLQAAGTATAQNQINELVFDSTIFGKEFEGNTIAVTTTRVSGNTRIEGDIIFNNKRTWDSYRGNTRSGVVDIQRVALHELGHLLGLDHPDEAGQSITPTPIMNSSIGNRDSLTNDDTTGSQNLYGPPGIPANDNFANAITLNLGSGTSLTANGFNTNATKETGEPRHANNLGGHSVWWKWLALSPGNVSLDTRNSYFDTTLGVYTGSAVGALTTIASNDDINSGIVQASSLTFTAVAGTTYYFAVDGFDEPTAGITLNLNFTSTGPAIPTITSQPTNQTVTAGQTASFSVTAIHAISSSLPTYQWLFNNVAIAGATSTTLSISNAQSTNAGTYTVNVSNVVGTITSSPATLTVNPAPVVTPTPTPTKSGGGGGSPSLWFLAALCMLGLARRARSPR